jgi:hypothetical protein
MKRDEKTPSLDDHKAMWAQGLRWCYVCYQWVRAEEWNRQYRCIGAIGVCRLCIQQEDARERRIAPEPVMELKRVATPPRLLSLWEDTEEDDA